jgi:predicted flap endonuclease-1-like 5' DNA nuclease
MACSSCGGRKSSGRAASPANASAVNRIPTTTTIPSVADVANDPNYIEVIYHGPNGNHFVPSPTRKVRHYGYGSNGDKLRVHRDDIAARPTLFVPTETATPEPELPPPPPAPDPATLVPANVPDPIVPDDLTQIDGVGPARAAKLNEGGYLTFSSVAGADVTTLSELLSVTVEAAQAIINSATMFL